MQLQSNCWCSYKVTKLCKSVFEEMRVLQIREHLRCWGPPAHGRQHAQVGARPRPLDELIRLGTLTEQAGHFLEPSALAGLGPARRRDASSSRVTPHLRTGSVAGLCARSTVLCASLTALAATSLGPESPIRGLLARG